MKLTIDIPQSVEDALGQRSDKNLEQAIKESLAIAWYQAEQLSIGQVAEFLGIPVYEADGLMKRHQVAAPYSLEDFEHDRDTLRRLLNS